MVPSHRTTRVHGQEAPTITPYRDRLNAGEYLPKPDKTDDTPKVAAEKPKTSPAKA